MKKRFFALLLTLCLVVSLLPAQMVTAEGETATLTAPVQEPAASVALSVGSNSVELPANSSVSCTVTPENDGQYATYLFYVENDYQSWTMSVPNDGISVFSHVTNTAYGYSLWMYGEGQPMEMILTNTGSEDVVLPLFIGKAEDATDVTFVGMDAVANIGETDRLQVLAATSTGRIGMVDWSVDGPAELKQNEYDPSVVDVTFIGTGTVTIQAQISLSDSSFTKDFVVEVVDPSAAPTQNNVCLSAYSLGMEATYTISRNGEAWNGASDGVGLYVPAGSSLKDEGYAISEPVFWDPSREFLGWEACTLEPIYEDGVLMRYDYLQIPGTDRMDHAQMHEYVIPADTQIYFCGVWAGEETDYFSTVGIDAFGGTYDLLLDDQLWRDDYSHEGFYSREGQKFSEEFGRYHGGGIVGIADVKRDGNEFLGWIQYVSTAVEGGGIAYTMVERETALSTEQMLEMSVMEDDVMFLAYWNNVSWDEYLNYGCGEGGNVGGGEDGQIPEDVNPTVLTLDQKAPFPGDWVGNYYSFTAPADGYYNLCYDSFASGADLYDEENGYFWISPQAGKTVIYLQADEEYLFRASTAVDAQIWVEKGAALTKLEIVEYDTTKVFQKSEDVYVDVVLDGVTVKATLEDGTTQTATFSAELGDFSLCGYQPVLEYDFVNATGETGTVTLRYADVSAQFTVKLTDKTVVALEVVSDSDPIEVIENTMGWMDSSYNGETFYYYALNQILASKAVYRFTWSDNTTETVSIAASNPYYYGVYVSMSDGWMQSDAPWSVGNTYDLNVYYGNLSAPVSIKIVESPVAKVEVTNEPIIPLGEPGFAKDADGTWYLDQPDLNDLEFKVTMQDQSSQTYKFSDLEIYGYNYYAGDYPVDIEIVDFESAFGITGACEIPVQLRVGGIPTEFNIHVVEKLVEDNQATMAPSVVEDALSNMEQTGNKVVVNVTTDSDGENKINSVKLPTASMDKVADANVDMTVQMDKAEVTFDAKAMQAIVEQAKDTESATITLSVESVSLDSLSEKQRHKIESVMKNSDQEPLVLDITLQIGDETISDFDGGNVTIRVPFTPPEGTKGEDYAVWYVPEDGKQVQKMKTSYEDGMLIFITNHFSDYVAMKEDLSQGSDMEDTGASTDGKPNSGKPGTPAPNTGDDANIFGFTTMLVISGMLAVAFLALRKRSRA